MRVPILLSVRMVFIEDSARGRGGNQVSWHIHWLHYAEVQSKL